MKIVIAIDKFKGCATSLQLAQAIAQEIKEVVDGANVVTVPIADGGDGTMLCIKQLMGDDALSCRVDVPAPLPQLPTVTAEYLIEGSTAYMDLATASGLALVPAQQRDVMHASTLGTGMMIAHAMRHGARHIVLGQGGSATCDVGIGILSALGFLFLDKNGNQLQPCGDSLRKISTIDSSRVDLLTLKHTHFTLLTDVDIPLYGINGAAQMFAPQKGATPKQTELLENGLRHFAQFLPQHVVQHHGAGAAGGVPAGMMAMLNATIVPGVDFLLKMAHFDDVIADAQLIITGEGRIDEQTAHGKAPAGVLRAAHEKGVPVIALCGTIAPDTDLSKMGFQKVVAVTPQGMPLQQALDTPTALCNVKKAIRKLLS